MTGAGTGRPYRLRACAMVTTRSWTPEIIEFGRVDIETRGDEVVRSDKPMSALYRQTGCLPEPDDVAGINENDLRRRRSCTPSVLKRAIWAPTPPDVLVAHGASRMRMLIPATTHMPLPWDMHGQGGADPVPRPLRVTRSMSWPYGLDYP